jgi:twitching motility protein PilT
MSSEPQPSSPDQAPSMRAHSDPVFMPARALSTGVSGIPDIRTLLELAVERGASDLHLLSNLPPMIRVHGELCASDFPPLSRDDVKRLIFSILTDRHKTQFERDLELDLSIGIQGVGRFRVNVHLQRGSVEAAFRLVPPKVPTIADLGLPPVVAELARKQTGLVLVTGPTGVGKTTTLASMVELINTERKALIITIEDPIEYLHTHKRSIIKQREVYADTKSFANALIHALRQDPNVIVVGEMRDLETISTALTAAETGHLVLATLHTPDAPQTIDRILDVFPPYQQEQVKVQFADCLQGIISQQLLPRIDRPGRVVAAEVLIATPAVRNLIREHSTNQLLTVMQTGAQYGMCTMDSSLKELFVKKVIDQETALGRAKNPEEFLLLAQQQKKHTLFGHHGHGGQHRK